MGIEQAIETLTPSIVQIMVLQPGQFRPTPIGTGFVVTESGLVATAKHVTQGGLTGQLFVGFADPNSENRRGNFAAIGCGAPIEDDIHDLAILAPCFNEIEGEGPVVRETDGRTRQVKAARLDTSRPRDGTSIAVSGYPLQQTTLVTTYG